MPSIVKNLFNRVRTNLTRLDNQPLGKAALVIILFLDVFILVSLFDGLEKHTRQLTSPEEHIPYACRQIVLDTTWNPTNRVETLSFIALTYSGSYYYHEKENRDVHELCRPYMDLIDRIKRDNGLTSAFDERGRIVRESADLRQEIEKIKGAYDTTLLEATAGEAQGQPRIDAVQTAVRSKAARLNTLTARLAQVEEQINANDLVKQLWSLLDGLREADRDTLRAALRRLNFWYPVKRLAMQMIFLLPLLAIFFAWNGASIKSERGVQTLVSSHLLVVTFIPVLAKIFETVYDIIPKKLLKKFIELLESLKLVAIWHYLVMALAVAGALFLIYIFQKKLFSREKLIERRIAKGQCLECGKHLPPGSAACPFCGFAQLKPCASCGKPTLVYAKYCRECGNPMV